MNQTIIFILLALFGVVVFIMLIIRKSTAKKEWQDDSVYERLKMLEDGWSVDEVLKSKLEEDNSEDVQFKA